MLLTYKELERLIQFANSNNNCNVNVEEYPTEIGSIILVQTQADYCNDGNNTLDITDIDSL